MDISRSSQKRQINTMSKNIKTIENTHIKNSTQTLSNMENGMNTLQKSSQTQKRNRNLKVNINENYTDVDSLNINNSRKQTRSSNRRKKTDDNNSHEEEKMLSYVIPGTSTHKRVYLNVTDTNVNYGELAFNTKKPTVHLEYITNYPEYKDAIARLPRVPPDRSLLRALFKSSAPKRKTRKRKSKTKNKGNNQSEIKSKSANNSEGKIVFFNQMPITGDASDDEINCYSESETFVRRTRRSVAKTRTDTEETEDESDFRRPLFAAGSYLSSTPLSSNNTLAKVKRNQKQLSSNTETNHKNISSINLPLEEKSSSDLMIQPITETHIAAKVSNTSDTSREFVENSMSSQFKPQQKRPRGRPKKIPLNNTNNLNSNETKSESLLKNTTSQSENIVNKFKKPKPTLTNNSSDIITLPHEHSENKTTNCDNSVSSLNCEDTISASEFLVNPFIDCDTFMSNEHLKPCSVSLTKIGDKKKQGVLPDLLNEIYMDQTMPIDEEENQFNEQLQKEYVTFNKANKFRTMQTKRNKLLVNKRNNLDLELLDTCYDQVEDADHLPLHSKIIGLSSGIVKDQDPKVRFLDTTVSNLCIDNYAASKDIKDKMLDNVNIETNTTESAIFTKNKDCTFSGKTSSTENKLNIEITCTNKNKTSDSEHPNVSKDNISNAVLFQCELELMLSSEKNNAKESKCKQKESDKLLSPNLDEINKTRNENHKLTASSEINTVTEDALVTSTVKDVATVKIFDIEDSKNIKKSSTKIFHNEISKVETVHVQHNNNYTKLPMPKDSCNKTVSPGESKEKFDNSLQTLNKNPVDFEEEYKTEIKIAELISNTEVKLADPTNPNLKETNKLEKIISNESFEDLLPAVINQNDNEFNSRKQRRKKKTLKDVVSVSSVIKSMKDIKQNNTEILRKDKTKKEDAQVPLMTSTIYRTKSKGALKNFDCLNDSNIILSLKTPSSSLKDLKVAPSEEKKVTLLEHTTGIPFEEKKTNPSEGKKITLLEDTKVIQYAEKKVNPSDAKKVSLLEENKMKQLEDTKVIQFEEKKVNPSDAKKVSLLEENKMKQLEDTKVIQFEEKKVNPSEAKKVTLLEENKLKQLETTKVIPFKEKKVSLLEEKKVKLLETTKVIPFKEKKVNPSEAKEVTLLEKKKMTLLKDIKVMPIKEKHVTPLKEKKEILLKDKKLTQLEDKKVTRTEEIKETPLEAIVSTKLKDVVLKSKNKEWPKTDTPIRKVVKRPNSQTSNKNNGSIIKKAKLELSLNKEKKIINKMETKININESKVKVINPEKAQPQKHSTSIVKNSLNFTDRLAELDEKFVKEIKKPLKKISGSNKNNFKNTNSQIMKSCRKRNFADTDTLETQQVKVVEKKVAINEGNGSIVGESLKSPDKHPNIVLDTIHFNGHITVSLDKSNKLVPSYDSKVSRILPSETGCNNRSKSSKVNILLNGINKKKIENQLIEGISKINTKPMKAKDIQNSVDIASDKTQKNVKQTEKSGKRSRVVAFHPTVNFIGGEPLENANLNDKHIFFEADISKKLCVGSVDSKEISANSASEKLSKKVEQKDNKTIKQLSSKAVTPKAVIPSFKQTPQKIINDEDTFFGIKIKKTVKNTTVQNSEHQIIEINTNRKKEVNTAQTKRNVRRKNNSLFNMIDIKKQQSNKIPTNKNVESKECRLNKKINGKRKEANTPTFNKNNNKNLINKLSVNCDSVESDDNSSDSSSGSLIIEIDSAPSFVDPNIPNTLISDIVPNTSHYRAISPSELHIGSNMEVETVLDNDTWGSDQIDDDDDDSRMDYTQYNFH